MQKPIYHAHIEHLEQPRDGCTWTVRVGWLRGKVERDRMNDWCIASAIEEWRYDKGGNWYFRYEEDATMFLLAWGGEPA